MSLDEEEYLEFKYYNEWTKGFRGKGKPVWFAVPEQLQNEPWYHQMSWGELGFFHHLALLSLSTCNRISMTKKGPRCLLPPSCLRHGGISVNLTLNKFIHLGVFVRKKCALRDRQDRQDKTGHHSNTPPGINSLVQNSNVVHFQNQFSDSAQSLLKNLMDHWNSVPTLAKRGLAKMPAGHQRGKVLCELKDNPDEKFWKHAIACFSKSEWHMANKRLGLPWLITSGKAVEFIDQFSKTERKKISEEELNGIVS